MRERTRVVLVRHGETIWNVEGRLQGHLDSELTPRGIAQAESVAARLRGSRPAVLYSSDLGRARKTAQRIAESTGCPVTLEPRLRERALGIFEGLDETEISSRYPAEWRRFLMRDPDYRVPNGESSRERVERSRAVLEAVATRHPGSTIVLVTHGGILDGIFRIVVGLPLEAPRQFKIWNAGINLISRPAGNGGRSTSGARTTVGEWTAPRRASPPASNDTGGLASGGPASAAGDGWVIELWGDTGTFLTNETLDDI